MKRELVLAEWHRAQQALASATLLAREEFRADAVSRAYYAVFHAAKAALQVKDVTAETHSAVRGMFGLHLIKAGDMEAEWSVPLAAALDDRLTADYDAEASFTAKEARAACRDARAFLGRIRSYLRARQFTMSELRTRRTNDA
jgi:uncharacterized protein